MKQLLGSNFEREIRYLGDVRSALYVWKRENDIVAFFHTPVALFKDEEDYFACQLIIFPTEDAFRKWLPKRALRPEDAKLWLDAMGD